MEPTGAMVQRNVSCTQAYYLTEIKEAATLPATKEMAVKKRDISYHPIDAGNAQ